MASKDYRTEEEFLLKHSLEESIDSMYERTWNTAEVLSIMNEYKSLKPKKKTLDERHLDFVDKLNVFVGEYPHDMVDEFRSYWAEHGENDRKMRFEKQTSFNIKLRLARWKKNSKNWNKESLTASEKLDKQLGL